MTTRTDVCVAGDLSVFVIRVLIVMKNARQFAFKITVGC